MVEYDKNTGRRYQVVPRPLVMGTLPDNNDPPASFGTVVDPPNEKDNITIAYNNSTVKRTSVCKDSHVSRLDCDLFSRYSINYPL